MDDIIDKLEKAVITHLYEDKEEELVHVELTWRDIGTTFKYELRQGRLRWDFMHDYDCAGDRCPICGNDGEEDCLELTERELEYLKDKLIQANLKLMYVLK